MDNENAAVKAAVAQAEASLHPAATPEPAPAAHVAEAVAAPVAISQRVTLASWCATKMKTLRQVELLGAFEAVERAKKHTIDTPENFEAALEALKNTPTK